jgi:hypothetical protein
VGAGITGILNVVSGAITTINSLLTGEFAQAGEGAKQVILGLIEPIRSLLFGTREQTVATQGLIEKFDALSAVTPGLATLLNNIGLATPFPPATIAAAEAQVGLLKKLEDQLKALKDAKPDLTTEADIAASNIQIKSLEAQIKRLNELGVGSKKSADAIAKLRLELARLNDLDNLLGDAPNELQVAERRADALAKGLRTLIDAGVSPSNRAFQEFAAELVSVGQSLDTLKGKGASLDLKPISVKSLIPQTIGDTLDADVARLLGDYAKKDYVLPLHLEIQPIEGGITSIADFNKSINGALLDIGAGFRQADAAAAAFGIRFDEGQAKADALKKGLEKLIADGVNPSSEKFKALAADYQKTAANADINTAATAALANGLGQLGVGLLQGLGQLATGNITLEAFGGTILGLVGDLATKLGEAILAIGIGLLNLKTAFTNPLGAIAAGAALIVVGAAISSIASSAVNSGGGSVTAPSGNYNTSATAAPQKLQITVVGELHGRGPDLVAVLRENEYREQRTR